MRLLLVVRQAVFSALAFLLPVWITGLFCGVWLTLFVVSGVIRSQSPLEASFYVALAFSSGISVGFIQWGLRRALVIHATVSAVQREIEESAETLLNDAGADPVACRFLAQRIVRKAVRP